MVEGVQVRSGYDVKIYYHSGDVERVNGSWSGSREP